MKLQASYVPLAIEKNRKDPFYFEMYSTMQLYGLLMPFTEQMNWDNDHGNTLIGDHNQIKTLKKAAAKNDGVMLWYAKLMKDTIYRHLILHSLQDGYLLPLSFEKPFAITADGKTITFCSAKKLLDECKWLEIHMNKNYLNTDIYAFWKQLITVCQTSLTLNTPVKLQLVNVEKSK
jgi:hypothetical protein